MLCVASAVLSGCASHYNQSTSSLSSQEQMLIGAWEANIEGFEHDVVIRRPDHTFEEHSIRIDTYGKPAVRYHTTGTWKIDGASYCTTVLSISYTPYQMSSGKERCWRIQKLTQSTFVYYREDAPTITENKIYERTAKKLWNSPLQLIGIYHDYPIDQANQ